MDNNINDIDKFFKDRLDGHESEYVSGAWENMEAMLDADDSGSVLKNINQYILASVAGAIILAGSVVAYISGYNTNTYAENVAPKANEQVVVQAPASKQETNNTSLDNELNSSKDINAAGISIEENTSPDEITNTPEVSPSATTPSNNLANEVNEAPVPVVTLNNDDKKAEETTVVETTDKAKVQEVLNAKLFTKNTVSNTLLTSINSEFSFKYPDFSSLITTGKTFIDSAQKAERKLDEIRRFHRLQVGIQAGGNFNRVLSTSSNNFQVGSGVMAGIFFAKNLSRRWAVNAELNYLRSTSNNIARNITQKEFFLEKTTTNFFLVTKALDYIQLPISVSYALTPKHRFSLGTSAMWLVNAKTEVAEQREKFAEKSSTTVTKNGVYEDLNTFNYGILLGYEFNLPSKYSLGIRYNQMFSDVTKNSFFNNDKKHLPAHLQLFVKLNLTR
jgi:hypothetical protein